MNKNMHSSCRKMSIQFALPLRAESFKSELTKISELRIQKMGY